MIRIGSIVLRVDDLKRQTEFWEAALGYVRRDSGESDDFVRLGPPDGAQKYGAFMEQSGRNQWQPVANARAPKTALTSQNRCHRLRPLAGRSAW